MRSVERSSFHGSFRMAEREGAAVAAEAVPRRLAGELEVLLADIGLDRGGEGEVETVDGGTLPSRYVHALDEGEV